MRFKWPSKGHRRQQVRVPQYPPSSLQPTVRLGISFYLTATLVCFLALGWLWRPQTLISGYATVIDGDTLEVDGQRVRLQGIDAPEQDQTCRDNRARLYRCGEASTGKLKGLVRLRKVLCRRSGLDRYQRFLGACWAQPMLWGTPLEISAAMVSSGHAVVYRYFKGKGLANLLEQQAKAKQLKLGMWQGSFQDPQDWKYDRRHQHASG